MGNEMSGTTSAVMIVRLSLRRSRSSFLAIRRMVLARDAAGIAPHQVDEHLFQAAGLREVLQVLYGARRPDDPVADYRELLAEHLRLIHVVGGKQDGLPLPD